MQRGRAEMKRIVMLRELAKEVQHVLGRLSEIVLGGDFWKRNGVRKKIDFECIAFCHGRWVVDFVTPVMIQCWANVPARATVGTEGGALVRRNVRYGFCAGRCKWSFVIVEGSEYGIMGGKVRMETRGAKQIQSKNHLWDETVPFGQRKFWIGRGKSGDEMIFECANRTFGSIGSMLGGWYFLEGNVVFLESYLELFGALIVDDV